MASQTEGRRGTRVLTGAASQGYSVASVWEHSAVLTEAQQQAIDVIAANCGQRPLPAQVRRASEEEASPAPATPSSPSAAEAPAEPSSFAGTSFEDVVLQNSSDFYRWLSELEAARARETEGAFRGYGNDLAAQLAACDAVLGQVADLLALFERAKAAQSGVRLQTAALHGTCQRLEAEQGRLEAAAAAIRARLAHFDELESAAAALHAAVVSPTGADILPLLARIDGGAAYVAAHPHYADSAPYRLRFKQLRARALAAVRARVQGVLRSAAAAAEAAERDGAAAAAAAAAAPLPAAAAAAEGANGHAAAARPAAAADGADTALLYVRFRAVAEPALKDLLRGLEERAGGSPEYGRLLRDCQEAYCASRLGLMQAPVARRLAGYGAQPLHGLLRSGCAYLAGVCQQEQALHEKFFPGSMAAAGLGPLLDPLCTLLYDALRPRLIAVQDIDALCEVVDILQAEVLADGGGGPNGGAAAAARRREGWGPLEPTVLRTLGDVQGRLSYRAQAFIREEIVGFVAGPADLDYPACLRGGEEAAAAAAGDGGGGEAGAAEAAAPGVAPALPVSVDAVGAAAAADGAAAAAAAAVPAGDGAGEAAGSVYGRGSYPPVARTLVLLSKLYAALPPKTFAGLAHEAVAAATAGVLAASRQLLKSRGPTDSQLFAIRQLLLLREQLAPFEGAEFSVVERGLDFSHMRDYLRRTLSGQLPFFSLAAQSAVGQLVSRGAPRLTEAASDARRQLERELKSACEGFIMAATKLAVEPMLSFITKVTAARVAGGGAPAKPLREQAFASPDRVAELVGRVREALAGPLPAAGAAMRLYLPSPPTRAALLKPIKSNVAEAHGQVAALLEAEYNPEEVAAIGLTPPDDLAALLDSLA